MKILKWVVITQWSASVLAIIIRAFALIVLLAMLTATPTRAGMLTPWTVTTDGGPMYFGPSDGGGSSPTGGMWSFFRFMPVYSM
jgi:hypothetical protein